MIAGNSNEGFCAMDDIDKRVNAIWNRVNKENARLMSDWIECFSGSYSERISQSKLEIKNTLTKWEYQIDPGKNFLWKLMSKTPRLYDRRNNNREWTKRDDLEELAMLFLRDMMENSPAEDFLVTTLGPRHSTINLTIPFSVETTQSEFTPLHNAARLENVAEVRELIANGDIMQSNLHGYTPLHAAAQAIHPNAEIARLLIDSVHGSQRCLDQQTDDEWGKNTALHMAAANVNVTEAFIQQFKEANPICRNLMTDTPFHVAAKSTNSDAIIYMLNTFAPTNNRWDVDNVDEDHKFYKTVITICARNGNAKAVELLIKHGADISQGVLHEIVLESVRNPEKIDALVAVYHSIVHNAVTWRFLEDGNVFLKFKGSEEYAKLFRETMIWLLTQPLYKYSNKDVLQCALDHGATAMFWEIINTKSVFRTAGEEAWTWTDEDKQAAADEVSQNDKENWNWTVFDVTNFVEETSLKQSASSKNSTENRVSDYVQRSMNRFRNITGLKRDYAMPSSPCVSYLAYLMSVFHQWNNSRILCTHPLKELTKPYIAMVQRFYFILGLIQMVFMISFTVYHMPTTCSLALMFNVFTSHCNITSSSSSNNSTLPPTVFRQRSLIAVLWLIWPIILILGNIFITVNIVGNAIRALNEKSKKRLLKSNELRFSIFSKLREALLLTLSLRIFCIMVFVWLYKYLKSETYESYVVVTGMVLLFGWITNLEFFGNMSMNFSISELVIKEIIVKEIPSFMLSFGFLVVGFSFAMHALRLSACSGVSNQFDYLHHTFFGALSIAFGVGDFYDVTISHDTCEGGATKVFFELVYLGYVLATMIVLLNVLIAMINTRYEKAKQKAENTWRYQMLTKMRALEGRKSLIKVMRKYGILDLLRPDNSFRKSVGCYIACCYGDSNRGSLIFNEELKRWYLKLLLPVDEQLDKP